MNTDEAQIVLGSLAVVTGESGRGLPHSKTLARSSYALRIYPKYGRLKSAEKAVKMQKLNQIKPN